MPQHSVRVGALMSIRSPYAQLPDDMSRSVSLPVIVMSSCPAMRTLELTTLRTPLPGGPVRIERVFSRPSWCKRNSRFSVPYRHLTPVTATASLYDQQVSAVDAEVAGERPNAGHLPNGKSQRILF